MVVTVEAAVISVTMREQAAEIVLASHVDRADGTTAAALSTFVFAFSVIFSLGALFPTGTCVPLRERHKF